MAERGATEPIPFIYFGYDGKEPGIYPGWKKGALELPVGDHHHVKLGSDLTPQFLDGQSSLVHFQKKVGEILKMKAQYLTDPGYEECAQSIIHIITYCHFYQLKAPIDGIKMPTAINYEFNVS